MQKLLQLRSDPQNCKTFTVKQKQCTVYQVHNKKLATRICIYIDSVTGNHEIFSGNEGKKVKLQNIFTPKQKQ